MTTRKKRWLVGIGAAAGLALIGLVIAAAIMARRMEPYVRQQAVEYLQKRFNCDVNIGALHFRLPQASPLQLLLTRGRGAIGRVEGHDIVMRQRGRPGPPLFSMKKFSFSIDLGTLFATPKHVPLVTLDGLEIHVPPKGERPDLGAASQGDAARSSVVIDRVMVHSARLTILPRDPSKIPLQFDIARLQLDSAGLKTAMQYTADMTNPKPPGQIHSTGVFGPWSTGEPGDTPLQGDYQFRNADLGVFRGIAGILQSQGRFEGALASITARGQAYVPDFRLTMAGHPVPLRTNFEVLVDGTNGNTVLKPVSARLGSTDFTTSGAIIKHEGDRRRAIRLRVSMPRGNMRDLLTLAMKDPPLMDGRIRLNTLIDIPPLGGNVRQRLNLAGRFTIEDVKFLRPKIQEAVDNFSRRAQGQPENPAIQRVESEMYGDFVLDDEIARFSTLHYDLPGAHVSLHGAYNLKSDSLDFRGILRLKAKISQTMTGWKRWALKPMDPFFSKAGAGTLLHIKVEGKSDSPDFGLAHGRE
ncbi:MAG TPA: hypothetical protein VFA28_04575 [Bryobacteraceae bacterium]|nr:hypothetical protein [Bryobacteraceae bacterium]